MPVPYSTLLGKSVLKLARLRGGGSAFPGLFVEKIDPQFVARTLSQLPDGIVLVTGTNGKTTTTKMIVELLESQGKTVFTNRTGSNFTRGVAAALLGVIKRNGKLDADIAVLELDEAYAVKFVSLIQPRYSLLLNVMRDQLDRFGEIDATSKMLRAVAEATTNTVVVNREDPRLVEATKSIDRSKLAYFGLSSALRQTFPADDDMRSQTVDSSLLSDVPEATSTLEKFEGKHATFSLENTKLSATLKIDGIYNVYNATAALGVVQAICGDSLDTTTLADRLETITPAFGRGEILTVGGLPLELVLVKNPGGFRLGLKSFPSDGYATMIVVNDNYADGRDMSWLWDVDFESLRLAGVSTVSGIRAYDMALRLQYDEVLVSHVDTDIVASLRQFIASESTEPKRIYCTYTAMLRLRKELSKITEVEVIT